MRHLVLAVTFVILTLAGIGDSSAQRVNPSFSVGPRGPSITNIGPRGTDLDRPRTRDAGPADTKSDSGDAPKRTTSKKPPRNNSGGGGSGGNNVNAAGMPPTGENRFVPDEVLVLLSGNADALTRRHRLEQLERTDVQLTGQTLYRLRIPDGRSVRTVIQALAQNGVFSQPNYLFEGTQQAVPAALPAAAPEGDPAQYTLAKLHLPQAHQLTKGDKILVAVIDSGVDVSHPDLQGVIAGTFDAAPADQPHAHGTAIAGAIAAHSRLQGVAPAAQILAVRAFGASGGGAQGTSFNILKGLDWAAGKGARIFNMSFAGPSDPSLARAMAAAHQRGIVLIAAVGNAGPKSPPLYPAADPNVIGVTATDADDKLFAGSNRGSQVAIAAPGVDILVLAPGGTYQILSGTSFAAAHISGIAALILERRPELKPDAVRAILLGGAKDLGPPGRDTQFGAGLADAYQSLMTLGSATSASR